MYSSMRMQPTDHMSDGRPHPVPRMTSGARYCRVLMTLPLRSQSYVAPPKSMTRMEVSAGASTRAPALRLELVLSLTWNGSRDTSRMFSSFRSVCTRPMSCMNATAVSSWSANACTAYSGGGTKSAAFR